MAKKKQLVPLEILANENVPITDAGYVILTAKQSGLYQRRPNALPEKIVVSKADIEALLTGVITTHTHGDVSYGLTGIVSTTYGLINLSDLIGTATGSYHIRIELQFGDLNHTGYKLSAHRVIEFSFVSYSSGQTVIHTEPVLMLQQHSGTIVRLSDNVVFDLNAQDIDFSTQLVSNMLRINVRNNLNTSPIPAANAAIKCRYTVNIKKFIFETVPEEGVE